MVIGAWIAIPLACLSCLIEMFLWDRFKPYFPPILWVALLLGAWFLTMTFFGVFK
jgi:hypothetical protein